MLTISEFEADDSAAIYRVIAEQRKLHPQIRHRRLPSPPEPGIRGPEKDCTESDESDEDDGEFIAKGEESDAEQNEGGRQTKR